MMMNSNPQPNLQQSSALEQLLARRPVILQLLKFGAIGGINTALDFLLFNVFSKYYGITTGIPLALINVIGFSAALVQSYFWNRAWAFGVTDSNLLKNFIRLFVIGGLGFLGILLVLVGSKSAASYQFYGLLAIIFVISEIVIWHTFKLTVNTGAGKTIFLSFVLVSLVGLAINSGVVGLLSKFIAHTSFGEANPDVVKNAAKIAATVLSLIWNFIGYKLLVFKK